ncbi:MAG TPA: hypothetical protein VNS46_10150 [Nocardioides sp.]|nr:hypothetical protein [Nocardioides sp.]
MTDGPQAFPPPGAPPPEQPAPAPQAHPAPGAAPGPPPPPGSVPAAVPGGVPPGWAAYSPTGNGPRPGLALGAAHKPGAFPLRPLGLGDMYDGAFRIIRFNPKATVGSAVMVTAAAMLLPILVTAVLTFTSGIAFDASEGLGSDAGTTSEVTDALGLLAAYGSLLLAYLLSFIGIAFVTGMVVHVARAAAVGRRLDLGQAWTATRGKRWRLLGLTAFTSVAWLVLVATYVLVWVVLVAAGSPPLLLVGWGVVSVPAFLCLCSWVWIRVFYLAVPPLMLEDVGVFGAIGRGWTLTSRQFWRTFGIGLLTFVVASIGGSLLSSPFSLVGTFSSFLVPEYAALTYVAAQAVALVVQNAFTAPFLASVTSLQYVDLRMRKEALDVELLREAGIIAA